MLSAVFYVSAGDYHFKRMTSDDGLSQNYVDFILKDSKGFMWFATWCGLDRFDGYDLRHYNIQNSRMKSNFICCLAEDDFERLWVGTDMGLSVIDLTTGEMTDVFGALPQYTSLFTGSINVIHNDSKGQLWIAGDHGVAVVVFDGDVGKILNVYSMNTLPVYALAEDRYARIWLGLSSGQLQVLSNVVPGQFNYEVLPDCLNQKVFEDFKCLYFDKMDVFWIGTKNGLFRYNPYVNRLDAFFADPFSTISLPNNTVTDIAQDNTGKVWIGTLSGLALWKVDDMSFEVFAVDGTDESVNNNYINDLYVDDQNILWIGTDKGGVNWMFEKRKMFNAIKYNSKDDGSILPEPVNAILEDTKGNLWIGQVEGGLHLRLKGDKAFSHYYHTSDEHSLCHNTVSKIYEDSESRIWIGTWGGGLNLKTKKGFIPFKPNGRSDGMLSYYVSDMIEDKVHDGLWVAQYDGLQFYDFKTDHFENVFSKVDMPYSPQYVNCLYIDHRNRLWVGTAVGLYCLYLNSFNMNQPSQMSYDYYRYLLCDSPLEQVSKVISIYESENGTMWFGSNGGGLYKMEEFQGVMADLPETWKDSYTQRSTVGYVRFVNYSVNDGFSDNVIYTIVDDNLGRLWMSSNNGLMCFNPRSGECLNFLKSDGLLSNQFYWMAGTKNEEGLLYFGNMQGVNTVEPQRFKSNHYMPEVVLLSLRILNEKAEPGKVLNNRVYIDKLISEMDHVTIPKKDKSFSIDFASMDYEFPEKAQYAYKMEGFDNQWNIIDSERRSVYYTNLKQGDYTFRIRCTNSDGVWSDKVTSLDIRIKPPFLQTRFFQILLVLMVILGVIAYIRSREARLRKSREDLENKVRERTAELEEAYRKVENLTQERISIFTNITHEFKTPITLIRGPIEHVLNGHPSPEITRQLSMADRNASVLLSLVNQIMDFRKIEEGMMSLNSQQVEVVGLIRDMMPPFIEEAQKKGIQCLFYAGVDSLNAMIDVDKLRKILFNLMSNALKFTPANGSIKVELACFEKDHPEGKWLRLSVSDTGKGVPESDREKIFDCFYQVKSAQREAGQAGTGIGLFLCKELTRLFGGNIYVTDNFVGGACFVLEIPMTEALSDTKENTSAEALPVSPEDNPDLEDDEEPRSKPLLLLVEDNADMRQFIVSFMEDAYSVVEAQDGEEGWTMAQKYIPEIIISDVMMPRMDGIQLCKLIKSTFETSHIPVILLTALSSVQHQLEGLKAGADDYVSKPFDEMVLKAKVKNIVDRQEKRYHRFEETMNANDLMEGEQNADKQLLKKVIEVIEANYAEPAYDVSAFVKDMAISKSLFHKKLLMLTGQSAGRFIRNYRLNKAKEMMNGKSDMNISEIAYSVGFNDPKYFTRCFTKRYGVNPSRYINVNGNKSE